MIEFIRAVMTTDPPSGDPPVSDPPANPDSTNPPSDLSTLFTPEEVTAKQEAIAAAKAEEERRAGLTDEQRTEEDRVKAEEAASKAVPEEYADFTVPEGMALDADLLAEFKPLAKELNLPQGQAQKIVDLGSKMVQKTMEKIITEHEERTAKWLEDAKADPEIGEDVSKWDPKDPSTVANSVALRAFNSIASKNEGLKKMVEETGIGNHPDFIRVFYRIGQNMREDRFEIPGTGGVSDSIEGRTGSIFNHPSRKG